MVLRVRDDRGALEPDPLGDQQLAGVIMWVPAGLVYVGAGLGLFVAWIRSTERQELAV